MHTLRVRKSRSCTQECQGTWWRCGNGKTDVKRVLDSNQAIRITSRAYQIGLQRLTARSLPVHKTSIPVNVRRMLVLRRFSTNRQLWRGVKTNFGRFDVWDSRELGIFLTSAWAIGRAMFIPAVAGRASWTVWSLCLWTNFQYANYSSETTTYGTLLYIPRETRATRAMCAIVEAYQVSCRKLAVGYR